MTLPDMDIPFVLLDDSRQADGAGRSMLFHSPESIVCARSLEDVPAALEQIDAAVDAGFYLAGWVAYECGAAFEPRLQKARMPLPDEPLIWMMVTRHREFLTEVEICHWLERSGVATIGGCIQLQQPQVSEAEYARSASVIKSYIEAGDIYQANYTFPYDCFLEGSALQAYRKLRARQPVDYGAFIETGENTILSFSPELFVRRSGNRVQARPMKGTAPRCAVAKEDASAAVTLSTDGKSRAENLMIVDLIRNDLSRIAVKGSVSVTDMFTVETYPTVHQMTSGVEASVENSLTPSELLRALFPCGSVTGAPKIRAMEIIADLEAGPRGVYCGAIGHFSPAAGGEPVQWALNVPIRTVVLDKAGQGRLAVGSGIVADSDIDDEHSECILKAEFASRSNEDIDQTFHLIETMRVQGGVVFLQDRHMSRLMASARYFGISVAEKDVLAAVQLALISQADAEKKSGQLYKLRLTVDGGGGIVTVISKLDHVSDTPLIVRIAQNTLESTDRLLRHKTSLRSLYDRASNCAAKLELADILFLNEKGGLAEGAISNIFIETADGWFTPPLESGALPGVLRAEMLACDNPDVKEKYISVEDLKNARAIYIGNALRGLRRVTIQNYTPLKL